MAAEHAYIYLLQDGADIGTNLFKPGQTVQSTGDTRSLARIKSYSKGTIVYNLFIVPVSKVDEIEMLIKKEFAKKYKLVRGSEWFEGDVRAMKKDIDRIVDEYPIDICETPLVPVSKRSKACVKKNIATNAEVSQTLVRDIFASYNENTKPGDFVIDLDLTAKCLDAQKQHLMVTLRESYVENVDYQVVGKVESEADKKRRGPKTIQVLMTVECFKLLCMQSRSKKASYFRQHFLDFDKHAMLAKAESQE
jgi:hypothetical protein